MITKNVLLLPPAMIVAMDPVSCLNAAPSHQLLVQCGSRLHLLRAHAS